MELRIGHQVVFLPPHYREDVPEEEWPEHPEAEFGFITSVRNENWVFCRFFSGRSIELRTKSASELVDTRALIQHDKHPQKLVNAYVNVIRAESELDVTKLEVQTDQWTS